MDFHKAFSIPDQASFSQSKAASQQLVKLFPIVVYSKCGGVLEIFNNQAILHSRLLGQVDNGMELISSTQSPQYFDS